MPFKPLRQKNILCGLSKKSDGSMRLGSSSANKKNRQIFSRKHRLNNWVAAGIIHGNKIKVVSKTDAGKIIFQTDALITSDKNLALLATVADCFPVYFYDPENKVIALAHAGWRGTASQIAPKVVNQMTKIYGCKPKNIFCAIGPGIQQCHFLIKDDVAKKFKEYSIKKLGKNQAAVDLPKIIKQQLILTGIKQANIVNSNECTYCDPKKYFSFRRDRPKIIQAMMAYIMLT